MIERIDAERVRPAAYNPRESDPARLALVELSLRKLGWLLPIYIAETEADGLEILSGHQRHLVATERWGAKHVPIQRCPDLSYDDRRLVNIAFNRGTNDLGASDSCRTVTKELESRNVHALAARFPDLDPESPEAMPCLAVKRAPIADYVASCAGRWSDHAAKVSKLLHERGIDMPVVAAGTHVVNGVGRLQAAAARGETEIDVVTIPADRAELATALLNLLTMDFTIHERYADLLRYSNGRRVRPLKHLNLCFLYGLDKKATSRAWDVTSAANQRAWRRYYGNTVLDFGAGAGVDTAILRSWGVDSTPFEPWAYPLGGEDLDRIDLDRSRTNARTFLERVASTSWDSIFMASVLNSVPFDADRRHLIVLIAALATPDTRVFPVAASYRNTVHKHVAGAECANENASDLLFFALDYEPRIAMTSFDKAAKTQKFFTPAEFYDLWKERFEAVRADAEGGLVRAWAKKPRPLPWDRLEAAIRFEFDLPFPDGSRLGLVDEALEAFRTRAAVLPTCYTPV